MSDSFHRPLQTQSSKRQGSFVPNLVQTRLTRYALERRLSTGLFFLTSSPSCFLPSTDQGEAAGMPHMPLETDRTSRAVNAAPARSRASQRSLVMRQERCPGEAAGCFPETSQGGIYLGAFPSLWPPALEVRKPDFAGTPRRDPSVRRTLSLTQIMRPKYKPHGEMELLCQTRAAEGVTSITVFP